MEQNRVRIVDVADALGLSTATFSKVIHGKTSKISDETVKRVQQELERTGYIPNMAGILLARNNSRIIGVVVNDNVKYEGRVLEDGFCKAFAPGETIAWQIPNTEKKRILFYQEKFHEFLDSRITAVFAVSDYYALELMRFLQGKGVRIPQDVQIIGFDDNMASRETTL